MTSRKLSLAASLLFSLVVGGCRSTTTPPQDSSSGAPSTTPAARASAPARTASAPAPSASQARPQGPRYTLTLPKGAAPLPAAALNADECKALVKLASGDGQNKPETRAKLEDASAKGNPCAWGLLSNALLRRSGPLSDYQRALALATAVEDAGDAVTAAVHKGNADPSCTLFEMAHDDNRALLCYEREGDAVDVALMVHDHRGPSRDLATVTQLALKERDDDALKKELSSPSDGAHHSACDFAVTMIESNACAAEKNEIDAFHYAVDRAAFGETLSPAGRTQYENVLKVFLRYAEAQSMEIYWEFGDGDMRNLRSLSAEDYLRKSFRPLPGGAKNLAALPAVTQADLTGLDAKLKEQDKRSPFESAQPQYANLKTQYNDAHSKANDAYKAYEDAFVAFVVAQSGLDPAAAKLRAQAATRAERLAMYDEVHRP